MFNAGKGSAFTSDGRVEMDSNRVENLIRPHALTRKNALFAGHDEGAHAWARIASLIGTCRMNGVEPYGYMKAVLDGHGDVRALKGPKLCTVGARTARL